MVRTGLINTLRRTFYRSVKYDYSSYREYCGCVDPVYIGEGYSSDTVFPISTPIMKYMCLTTCIEGVSQCVAFMDGSSMCIPNDVAPLYLPSPPTPTDIPVVPYELGDSSIFWGDVMGGTWINGKWIDPNPYRERSFHTSLGFMFGSGNGGFNFYFNAFGDKVGYIGLTTAAGFNLDAYGFPKSTQNKPPDKKRTVYWRLVYVFTNSNNLITRAANTLVFCIPWPEGDVPPDPLEEGVIEPVYSTRRWSFTPCINEAI